ncbi:MAG: SEC-C metal-binding domain-containing protein [Thermodesulfobacteriota bacterium]|nr:SEC-C metal-binding domain-containing protein [Thermodesulfobacteriota bacterium]
MKIGRNDPCPCGSGKKYKKCCLLTEQSRPVPESIDDVFAESRAEIRELLQSHDFDSLDEANDVLDAHFSRKNRIGNPDFSGLSPEQMNAILYDPFDSPDYIRFSKSFEREYESPILTLFSLLVEAIGEEGLKPTAKGNLPQRLCRDAASRYLGSKTEPLPTLHRRVNKEDDFFDLHVTRIVAEMAGLVRKYRGKFILSRECRRILKKQGVMGVYPLLFRTYIEEYNWGYGDGYEDLPFIQQSFAYTLYLLQLFTAQWQHQSVLEERYVRAFPMLLAEIPGSDYFPPEQQLSSCYTLRAICRFAAFFGLVELEKVDKDSYLSPYRIKKLPLLDAVVSF